MEAEQHVLESGQELTTHRKGDCVGSYCVIHRPMPGPWDSWPRQWRTDRRIMERVCPHGVGHPAAEQHEFWMRTGRGYEWVHGCCGCPCHPNKAEGYVDADDE